ncbi:MAG: hypothetical protein VR69_01865 [Peptococcaceae bacterium BRH_c4b]|nr:MAG: hypothetical protein VR69_01865 [Peptococcaceae bacterium BRH_c4b]
MEDACLKINTGSKSPVKINFIFLPVYETVQNFPVRHACPKPRKNCYLGHTTGMSQINAKNKVGGHTFLVF